MRWTVFGVAVAGFFALLPFVDSDHIFFGALNTRFFFIVAAIDVLSLWAAYLLFTGRARLAWKWQWLLYALGAVVLTHFISALAGTYFERSLWSDIRRSTGVLFLTHLAVGAVLLGNMLTTRDWSLVLRAIAISTGLFGLLSFLGTSGFGIGEKILWLNFANEGFTFGNSTFAGVYLLLAFILTLIELARSFDDPKWRRILLAASAAIALSPIMINIGIVWGKTPLSHVVENPLLVLGAARASSATMLLLIIFFVGWLGIRKWTSREWSTRLIKIWSGGILLGVVAATALLFTPGSFIQEAYIETSTAARPIVWNAGFEAFLDKPLFGWGPENFNDAFRKYFDNRLYFDENIGEVWFDRAHNIFIETPVTVGVVGALALSFAAGVYLFVIGRVWRRRLVGGAEATLLAAIVPAHMLQLQTGFDTVASFVLLMVVMGYGLSLERALQPHTDVGSRGVSYVHKGIAILLVLGALISLKVVVVDEHSRQRALIGTFQVVDFERQHELVRESFSRTSDFEGLRLSTESFIVAALDGVGQAQRRDVFVDRILVRIDVYNEAYERYISAHPENYRARMNYAYLLLTETLFGRNKLKEAQEQIDSSYELSPTNPLTPALDALTALYSGNLERAQEKADEMIALNPDIDFSQEVHAYIDEQVASAPRISPLRIENL